MNEHLKKAVEKGKTIADDLKSLQNEFSITQIFSGERETVKKDSKDKRGKLQSEIQNQSFGDWMKGFKKNLDEMLDEGGKWFSDLLKSVFGAPAAEKIKELQGESDEGDEEMENDHLILELPSTARLTSDVQHERIHPKTNEKKDHKGIDVGMPEGTPLNSPGNGRVLTNRYSESAGWYLEVEYLVQGEPKVFRFMHLESQSPVAKGSAVKTGDLLAHSGATGRVTGPHLHLEVRNGTANGDVEDPMPYMPTHIREDIVAKRESHEEHDSYWS